MAPHNNTITGHAPAEKLYTNRTVEVGRCGYSVEYQTAQDRVTFSVPHRLNDMTPTAGVFAPWVQARVVEWFNHADTDLFTRTSECWTGGSIMTLTRVPAWARDEVIHFMSQATTVPAGVLPRMLAETIGVDGTRTERLLASLAELDPAAAELARLNDVDPDEAVETYVRALGARGGPWTLLA